MSVKLRDDAGRRHHSKDVFAMTQNAIDDGPRTKHWTLRLDLFEEGDLTKVHAVLDTGDTILESRTEARRSPRDTPVPEIGDEFAAGRALVDLGHRLLRAGTIDSSAEERTPHT